MIWRLIDDILVIRMDTGDDIYESVKSACRAAGVTTGFMSGFGATRFAEIHAGDEDAGTFGESIFEGKMELVTLTGDVLMQADDLCSHIHVVLAGPKGLTVYAGHLEKGIVQNLCEIYLYPLKTTIGKRPFGPWYIMDLESVEGSV